ncbi:MAG: hypothetical protein QOI94_780 [Acidobacteriaceae bacterium]|nr:hypothetical protein [Acidobacteriaceae bacterium]
MRMSTRLHFDPNRDRFPPAELSNLPRMLVCKSRPGTQSAQVKLSGITLAGRRMR